MPASIPDDLTDKEFNLLLHLATCEMPRYFEDIQLAFSDTKLDAGGLYNVVISLEIKGYARYVSPGENKAYNNRVFLFERYTLTKLGRKTTRAWV